MNHQEWFERGKESVLCVCLTDKPDEGSKTVLPNSQDASEAYNKGQEEGRRLLEQAKRRAKEEEGWLCPDCNEDLRGCRHANDTSDATAHHKAMYE